MIETPKIIRTITVDFDNMRTTPQSRIERLSNSSLIASLLVLCISLCSSVSLTAQDVCSADTSFTDILFVIDNSGSIDDQEYDEFSDIIMATIRNVQSRCVSSQIGVLHYGGAFGTETFLEFNFSRFNTIPDVERQFCTTRNQFGNCSEGGGDDLNAAMGTIVEGIQNGTLNRRPINKLALVIFTDAFGFDESCNFINCSVIRPFTNIDILKSQFGAQVTVIGASSQAEATLLGLYASPGGTFDDVRLFPQDCASTFDGCQLPRKYIPIEFDSPILPTSDSISSCVDCSVEIIDGVMAEAGEDQMICEEEDGSVTLTANLLNATRPITYTWDQGVGSGNNIEVSPLVTTTYTVTATDANGCSSTDQVTITVEDCIPDCEAPIINCPPDYTSCPGGTTDPSMTGMATASNPNGNNEFCGNVIVTYSDEMINMGDCTNQMIIRRTFTATDSLNTSLTSTCVQIISLIDTIAPMILTCPEDVVLDPDNPIHEWQDPTVEENCSFRITYSVPNGSSFATGETIVTATATDQCGNFDTCSFVVTVPEEVMIICPEDVTLRCVESMSAADIPDAEVVSNCPLCVDNPTNCTQVQSSITDTIIDGDRTIYEITYVASDLCNTSSFCTAQVIIDNSSFIECPSDIIVEAPPFGFTNVSWERPEFQTCCSLCKVRQIPGFLYMGQLGDSYYYCSYARVNWAKAQRTAVANEGHLVAINSALENEFIASRLIEREAYIGLTDSDTEGSFLWVNGDPLGYENWKAGQPDNDNNQDVVEMNAQGYWFDVDGKEKREFVMEIQGCQHVTQIDGPSPGSKFRLGRTPITYVAEDGCGNRDTCSFDVVLTPFLPIESNVLLSVSRSSQDIEVSPNPASSNLYITNKSDDPLTSIDVYQINGQLIHRMITVDPTKVQLDVSGYQSGLHLIRLTTQRGNVFVRKVVIE